MSTGILRIEGEQVVDGQGNPIILRGAGLGGWMKYVQDEPRDFEPMLILI